MKKVLLVTFGICALSVSALHAVPVLGPPVTQCLSFSGVSGSANDLIVPYSVWSAANFACEQQDKIYSNFNAGVIPNTTTLRLQVQPLGAFDLHTVTLNGNFLSNFTVSYDIAVDLTLNPIASIVSVTGDISNPSGQGTPTNTKTVSTEAGVTIGSLTSSVASPGGSITTNNTALHAVDVYTANGGAVVSISNTYRELVTTLSPEPFSFALMGSGIGLILLSRRIRRA